MIKRTSTLPTQAWKGQVINTEVYGPYMKFKESENEIAERDLGHLQNLRPFSVFIYIFSNIYYKN